MSGGLAARVARRPEAAPAAFLLAATALLAATTPGFAAPANLLAILTQASVVGVVAMALNFVILTGEIDVSVGSVLAACAFVYAVTATGPAAALAWPAAVAVGAAAGGVNALLVTVGRVPSIIATLGMLLAVRGGVLLEGADGVVNVPEAARVLGAGSLLGAPIPLVILAVVTAAAAAISYQTVFGRDVFAVGGSARAAQAVGLNLGLTRGACFVMTGAACGVASGVFAGQIGQIQATVATGFELQAIAAVVLGGASITGGRSSVAAPLLGAVLVGGILNALTLRGVPPTFEQLVMGLLILAAISFDALRRRLSGGWG